MDTKASVIQHRIQNFLSCHCLLSTHYASVLQPSFERIPTCVSEALSQPKGKNALVDEMQAHMGINLSSSGKVYCVRR